MTIQFDNKTALVLGASQGIGLAIAQQLALNGATVILLARSKESLVSALSTLKQNHGQTHSFICADADDDASIENVCNQLKNTPIDILINNSGGPPSGALLSTDPSAFLVAMQRLLLAAHRIISTIADGMKERNFGRIINIVSTSVRQPIDNLGVSNTIRGATASWSKSLATELAPYGITVNNVLPGATSTTRLDGIIDATTQRTGKSRDEVVTTMLHEIPMKRFATPDDIAYSAVFLASSYASYITGTNIIVDGGRTRAL